MSSDVVIKASGLSKSYQIYDRPVDRLKQTLLMGRKTYFRNFAALSDVSFEIRKGESLGIVGMNGSGKSTLLQILCGVLTQTTGEFSVDGRVAALLELGAGFNPEYTGRENVYLNSSILGVPRSVVDAKMDEMLRFADIGAFIDQPVKTYSSGMFVRLAFASAINLEPDVLVVDEALAVGDIFFQQKCFSYLKHRMQEVTKVFVTHDLSTLSFLADRVIVMEAGSVMFDGDPSEAIKHYQRLGHSKRGVTDGLGPIEAPDRAEKGDPPDRADFKAVSTDRVTGTLDAVITGYRVLINGECADVVRPGDSVKIELLSSFARDAVGVHVVGFFFRDRHGQNIFGQNTLSLDEEVLLERGVNFISFGFDWPDIREAEYTLTVGVGEIALDDELDHDVLCWANNVQCLTCLNNLKHDSVISVSIYDYSQEKIQ